MRTIITLTENSGQLAEQPGSDSNQDNLFSEKHTRSPEAGNLGLTCLGRIFLHNLYVYSTSVSLPKLSCLFNIYDHNTR